MPLLPLFYLHHRVDGTAVLMSRDPSAEAGRASPPPKGGERPAASAAA